MLDYQYQKLTITLLVLQSFPAIPAGDHAGGQDGDTMWYDSRKLHHMDRVRSSIKVSITGVVKFKRSIYPGVNLHVLQILAPDWQTPPDISEVNWADREEKATIFPLCGYHWHGMGWSTPFRRRRRATCQGATKGQSHSGRLFRWALEFVQSWMDHRWLLWVTIHLLFS